MSNDNTINGTPKPCLPYPDDASYKTIALGPCPRCGSTDCWRRYLSWEKSLGITINEKDHPAEVDPDHVKEQPGIVVAAVPIVLEGGNEFFEVSLREPGIVRACAFHLHQPKVIASAMRMQPVAMPLLLVEMRTDGELRRRKFFFVPSDSPLAMKPGFAAKWIATALLPNGAGHLFEVVEAAS